LVTSKKVGTGSKRGKNDSNSVARVHQNRTKDLLNSYLLKDYKGSANPAI
jgi:hypothetical protein